MTREEWAKAVFERDRYRCVVPWCDQVAVDPHHIIERKLWPDGGYVLENVASLCAAHHVHAERSFFPPQALRQWLSLPTVLPPHLDPKKFYDKWGNEIPAKGGYTIKYPKTPYLVISPQQDPEFLIDIKELLHKPIVITTKMDGSNVTLTRAHVGARNGTVANHSSFDYLKAKHSEIKNLIPEGIQLFCEWLFAKHSIHYNDLEAYLQVITIYDQQSQLFWSFPEVREWCEQNGFSVVPILGEALFDTEWEFISKVHDIFEQQAKDSHEGIVIRNKYPFYYVDFSRNVGKMVREGHNQIDETAWAAQKITKNKLK